MACYLRLECKHNINTSSHYLHVVKIQKNNNTNQTYPCRFYKNMVTSRKKCTKIPINGNITTATAAHFDFLDQDLMKSLDRQDNCTWASCT